MLSDTEKEVIAVTKNFAWESQQHPQENFVVSPEFIKQWMGTLLLLAARCDGSKPDIINGPVEYFDYIIDQQRL